MNSEQFGEPLAAVDGVEAVVFELSFEERKKVHDAATAELLEALEQLEDKPAANGKTWLELITSGEWEGIRIKE